MSVCTVHVPQNDNLNPKPATLNKLLHTGAGLLALFSACGATFWGRSSKTLGDRRVSEVSTLVHLLTHILKSQYPSTFTDTHKDPRRQARATTSMFSLAGVGFLSGPFLVSTLFSELRYGFIFVGVLMILGGLLIHVTLFTGPAYKRSTSLSPLTLEVQTPTLTHVLSEDHVKDQGKRGSLTALDSLISAVSISTIHSSLDSRWPAMTSLTSSSLTPHAHTHTHTHTHTLLTSSSPVTSASSTSSSTCSASPRTSPVLTAEFSPYPCSPPSLAPVVDR
jgi:hypothetical protein